MKSYTLTSGETAIRCLFCGHTSWNANDIRNRYCGSCHHWHEAESWTDLGPCCACSGQSGLIARNLILLTQRATTPGTGWGCFTCGLPSDGATAVVCDECLNMPILYAIAGLAAHKERIPVDRLPAGEFDHDYSKHPEFEDP